MKISQTIIDIYKRLFVGRSDFYWKYTNNVPFLYKYQGKNIILKDSEIELILMSRNTLGLSPFVDNHKVLYGAVDIDAHTSSKDTYKDKLNKHAIANRKRNKYIEYLKAGHYTFMVNSSGSNGGWHIRIYPPQPMSAIAMREFVGKMQRDLFGDIVDELYPKQDELTEVTPYGNQLKAPLSLHQKHNKFATIYDVENDKVMSFEDSTIFLLDFIEEIPNAKMPFVDITHRRMTKATNLDNTNMVTPQHCRVIEEFATKYEFPTGGLIRHHYIDPNVAVYVKEHPNIELPYLKAQGKPRHALSSWKRKHNSFLCWQIQLFLKHYENSSPLMKKCLRTCKFCPYNNIESDTTEK